MDVGPTQTTGVPTETARAATTAGSSKSQTARANGGPSVGLARHATDDSHWRALLTKVWRVAGHQCVWCGGDLTQKLASAHHLIPRGWEGSTDEPNNLALVHREGCHDDIDLWTTDHGRPPTSDELVEHRGTGYIHEPAVRYQPRMAADEGDWVRETLRAVRTRLCLVSAPTVADVYDDRGPRGQLDRHLRALKALGIDTRRHGPQCISRDTGGWSVRCPGASSCTVRQRCPECGLEEAHGAWCSRCHLPTGRVDEIPPKPMSAGFRAYHERAGHQIAQVATA